MNGIHLITVFKDVMKLCQKVGNIMPHVHGGGFASSVVAEQ